MLDLLNVSLAQAAPTAARASQAPGWMAVLFNILLVVSVLVALGLIGVIFITGKGDSMAGGSGVRTNFRGKATYEEIIARNILYAGLGFMALLVVCDVLLHSMYGRG